jgi:hypothetical protein
VLHLRQFSKLFLSLSVRQVGPSYKLKIIQRSPFFDRPVLGHNDCTDLPLNLRECSAYFLSIPSLAVQMLADGGLADSQELSGGSLSIIRFIKAKHHDLELSGGQELRQNPFKHGHDFRINLLPLPTVGLKVV